jgi:hypothetical protein
MRMAFPVEGSSLVDMSSECTTSACLIGGHAGAQCLVVHPQIEKPYSPSHLRCCSSHDGLVPISSYYASATPRKLPSKQDDPPTVNQNVLTAGALGGCTDSDCGHSMGGEPSTAPPGGRRRHSAQSIRHRHLESCASQPWQVPSAAAAAPAGASSTSSMAEQRDIPALLACAGQLRSIILCKHQAAARRKGAIL